MEERRKELSLPFLCASPSSTFKYRFVISLIGNNGNSDFSETHVDSMIPSSPLEFLWKKKERRREKKKEKRGESVPLEEGRRERRSVRPPREEKSSRLLEASFAVDPRRKSCSRRRRFERISTPIFRSVWTCGNGGSNSRIRASARVEPELMLMDKRLVARLMPDLSS